MPLDAATLARLDGAANRARMATFPSRSDITEIVLALRGLVVQLGEQVDALRAEIEGLGGYLLDDLSDGACSECPTQPKE